MDDRAVDDSAVDDNALRDGAPPDLLAVDGLSVGFPYGRGLVTVVRSASFTVGRGEIVGLVGESGSGKTVTSLAAMGLLPEVGGVITGGRVVFDGAELTARPAKEWSRLRGRRISMIFQQPTRSLNPAFTVGEQIAECVRLHFDVSRKEARARAIEMLDRVGIADAARRVDEYPHKFSGGMCQRVMIAIALISEPELLIADEPTTALDVTVQARILDLLREIQDDTGIGILYITHDLGVVAELCDRVAVMYAGETVEVAPVERLFRHPAHPYTAGLLRAIPRRGAGKRMQTIEGQVPAPMQMPQGCRFHPRCAFAVEGRCTAEALELARLDDVHATRCVRVHEIELAGVGR